ncbi:MAG TPA: hypothetical protein VHY08_01800 [Bacillota bacterium]|nr:hypothetical protein [Bacillota bacterium]
MKGCQADFEWQEGYGAFTLRRSDLPVLQRYIQNQEQHHLEGIIEPDWELPLEKYEMMWVVSFPRNEFLG